MKQKILLSTILFFVSAFLFAQETITISGVVKDDSHTPLPGATVMIKGTTIGTSTDDAGSYTLAGVPKDAKVLVVSYIGFENKEYNIEAGKGNYSLNVTMASTNITMNQVVVSVSKRKEKVIDAPASISVIGQDKLEKNVVTTPVDQLKTTPGVDIMRTGLVSSNVVIRGFNNIFSGSVLNVIDNRIGGVPSLRVNAYQLVPTSNLDYDKIEVVRGPASALYGPNASSGVVSIQTKSPLDQERKFETSLSLMTGFTALAKEYQQYNNGKVFSGNIINAEARHSGKLFNGKFGYKISGTYFQGQDYPYYDSREPYTGDSMVFGTVKNGVVFSPDTLKRYTHVDGTGHTVLDSAQLDVRRFKKDFFVRKWSADARFDIAPVKNVLITINGGIAAAHNIELTGLGAAQGGGLGIGWIYWYVQARFKWKNLFVQYFINSSNAGNTYLIPQLSDAARNTYNSTSPPTAYTGQFLIDKSKIHVIQVQHSYSPISKLNFVYGVDVQLTRPNTEGSINGRFETVDNLNQIGGYIQGDYEPLKWLKLVAAARVDYNSIIKNVAASPRAAIVFKVADNQSIRLTYNRAFDSPNTLNQFLDLSNGFIPNGINVRGIGNPYGWNYNYDAQTKGVQFITAPYGDPTSTQWITFGDPSHNAAEFNKLYSFLKGQFTSGLTGNTLAGALGAFNALFTGIIDDTTNHVRGTVDDAKHVSIDYAHFAQTKDFAGSIQNVQQFQNLKKINNEYTNTLELGYKGLFMGKLSISCDVYWTRINNYVSALTSASGAVMLDWKSYLGDKGTGKLWQNVEALKQYPVFYDGLNHALNNNPSYTNPTIVASDTSTIWDELVVLMNQIPIGTITPNDPKYVNSDYILTFKNLGRLDVFGVDLGVQYSVYETKAHLVQLGANMSWVDKDQLRLSTGEEVPLNAPKWKAGATFDHTIKKPGFGYGLTFRYQAGFYGNSSVYQGDVKPAYLLDARVFYRPAFYKGLLLALNVNNVANYQWASFPGTPKMGTQIYLKAQVTF